jgi:hypothetical protein
MRRIAAIVALALVARAQAPASTRTVKDASGRLEITVPERWDDFELAAGELLHLYARHAGGHILTAVREAKQSDVDKQRDRYMEHDAQGNPGAEFLKISEPFFGYRMNAEAKNRVILRAFLRDGADGVVLTVISRFQAYDTAWAPQTMAALGTARIVAGAAAEEEEGPARRLFDKAGRFSLAAPGSWKAIEASESELVALGHKGQTSATLRIFEEGEQDNPALVLMSMQNQWKRDYTQAVFTRVGTNPPGLLVKGRKEGWIDYIVAFAALGHGFTLRLAVREGSYEQFRAVADDVARSIVFMGDPYRAPADLPGEITREHRKGYLVHAAAEEAGDVDAVVEETGGFDKEWGRVAPAPARKGQALHVVLARAEAFADVAHGFGEPPAAYDRLACAVVAVPPPKEAEELARWRGRLRAALAEGALHRDLEVAPPPWLLAGLASCMDASGRSGRGPDENHPALMPLLQAAVDKAPPLPEVFAYSYGDVIQGETPGPLATSWGYTHLLLFGSGTLKSLYRKWEKDLVKATRKAPAFDLGKYTDAAADLKKHVEREMLK